MYNRYIPNGTSYTRVVEQDHPPPPPPSPTIPSTPGPIHKPSSPPTDSQGMGISLSGLSGLFDLFKLDDLDSGDILLVLILLFLFRDGDDIELLITLGLILLMGLGGNQETAGHQ